MSHWISSSDFMVLPSTCFIYDAQERDAHSLGHLLVEWHSNEYVCPSGPNPGLFAAHPYQYGCGPACKPAK
jgi:hypothetical protein